MLLGNALIGDIIRYVADYGLVQGIADVFGLNVLTWLGCAAALSLLLEGQSESGAPVPLDWVIAAVAVVASFVPTSVVSVALLTAIATYLYFSGRSTPSDRRAGAILISICAALLWGRIVLAMFSGTLLRLDSIFVSWLGLKTSGNRVFFVNDAGDLGPYFIVAPGCSSLHSISAAIVFSTVMHGWFGVKPTARSLLISGIAILAVVTVNVLRLGSLAVFPQHFDEIHMGWIGSLIGWATMVAIVAIICLGMKREIAQYR